MLDNTPPNRTLKILDIDPDNGEATPLELAIKNGHKIIMYHLLKCNNITANLGHLVKHLTSKDTIQTILSLPGININRNVPLYEANARIISS